ncbi:hypothetical protein M2105_004258 [Paenibacillus sp. PastF-1]|nr:hypothetical protein [Paenibacillus sp. PastF-2]MDF9856385.1 hypothetical protein [Paenibacillus sp. PastF-1]MDH6481657.1 hypothetical protein [Paenibacillus sp. PastH-2]MDH6508938.1 hypothetical protein [Paenibacillus sp. PastM-3]
MDLQDTSGSNPKPKKVGAVMKGERQQDHNRDNGERPFKYSAADRALGVEMSQAASVASAAAEFITAEKAGRGAEPPGRAYLRRTGERPAFLVLREGQGDRPLLRDEPGAFPAGPCLIRSEEWLQTPELAGLYECWLYSEDALQAERTLQRIYYRLRAASAALLESADSIWAAVTLLHTPELAVRPGKLKELQDVQLEALFAAVAANQRLGSDSRIDLLAPYPASSAEFAVQREFIEDVAEQTLGHAYAAACSIGARIAPGMPPAAAGEIARIADFLVLDGAAEPAAPEEPAAADFVLAAEAVLAAVRRVKPAAVVLAAGAPAAGALADLYRIGMSGIFCSAGQRTEALLRAACLTWMARQDNTDTAAEGWL